MTMTNVGQILLVYGREDDENQPKGLVKQWVWEVPKEPG